MVLNGGVRSYGWRWRDEHTGKIWHSPYSVRLKGEIVSGSRETENKGIDILLADSNIRIDRSRLIKYEINIALGFIPPEARHEYLAETLRKQVLGDYYKFESMWDMVLRFTELNTCKDGVYLEYCRQNCVFDANKYGVTCKGEICVAERKHRDGFYEQIPADILERKTISFW